MLQVIKLLLSLFKRKEAPKVSPIIIEHSDANQVLVHEAQRWVGVTEKGGDNKGPEVEMFQRAVDGKAIGEPWCAAFAMFCVKQVEQKLGLQSAIYKAELVYDIWLKSPQELRQARPEIGNLILWRKANTVQGHVGIIEAVNRDGTLNTIEGNTGMGSTIERNGDGVYRRIRTIYGTQGMPVLGFLRVFNG